MLLGGKTFAEVRAFEAKSCEEQSAAAPHLSQTPARTTRATELAVTVRTGNLADAAIAMVAAR